MEIIQRLSKTLLLGGVALFFSIVAMDNLLDYDSNYQFVRHVLMMDTVFPGNKLLGRAVNSPLVHQLFYAGIILTETTIAGLSVYATLRMFLALRADRRIFLRAKSWGVAALSLSVLLWLVAFMTIGGEFFLMWQSSTWNGLGAASRMFDVCGIILIYLALPEVGDPS